LIGASGSGKTTICNLIARFWDVDSGEIAIDGTNVKDYRYDNLLSNFSFVFQDVYLFDDTVKNNIAFGNPDATYDEIVEVAKHARCHDFIMALPDGFYRKVAPTYREGKDREFLLQEQCLSQVKSSCWMRLLQV